MPMSITKVEPATPEKFFDAGGEHFHVHTCPASGDHPVHPWKCNSPYCENMVRVCPDHGGKEPVTKGEEPWRG
jgi:hypothetical protein